MRNKDLFRICCASASILSLCAFSPMLQSAPVKVIFDTDMAEDVDDVGALAVLNALADAGEAEILACMISAPNEYVGPCIDAINTYYGRPDIPIGNLRDFTRGYPSDNGQPIPSNYTQKISEAFPHDLALSSSAPDAVELYRKILSSQPDQSVKIVSVGFLTNLKNLLNSKPDSYSPLDGEALVKQKVSEWVCMGANFPNGGREYNVMMDTVASVRAINDWPTPVVFTGFEIGVKIHTANILKTKPETSPVRMGYEWYWGGNKENINRESWDHTAVLYAVRGCRDYWTLSEPGKCIMHAAIEYGDNEWIPTPKGNHRYLIEKMPPNEVGKVIDDWMSRDPKYNYTTNNGFTDLFDGKTMDGWTVTKENPDSWKLVDGQLYCDGPRAHLFYSGNFNAGSFENYVLHIEAKALPEANSGVFINTKYQDSGWPQQGYEVQVNNTQPLRGKSYEHKKTGSLYNVRNVYKQLVADNEWFDMDVTVRGKRVTVEVNRTKVVDYQEPQSAAKLQAGTFALQCHDPKSHVYYRRVAVKPLPTQEIAWAPEPTEKQKALDRISASGFPLLDLHTHLKGGLTMDDLQEYTYQTGVNFGVAVNCGVGFPTTNDVYALQFLKNIQSSPMFFYAMQAEGREWVNMFTTETRSQFDYIFTDSMTFSNEDGKRMRLWIPDETIIGDPQAFMEMLVSRAEGILAEPIDIYVNPTYLPAAIAQDYDTLWTDARMNRVIAAAVAHNVAIEINGSLRLPSAKFIKKAKAAGLKFTFGTNNASPDLGDHLGYAIQMIQECGLEPFDMWVPGKFVQSGLPTKQKKGLRLETGEEY